MKTRLETDRTAWDALMADQPSALQQDWCYGEAVEALGGQIRRVVVEDDAGPLALAQFTTRRVGMIVSLALCARGPVWLRETDPQERRQVYALLKRSLGLKRPRAVMVSPDTASDPGAKAMTRVMTGHSTVMLDLDQDLDALRKGLAGKWRNRLVAAEKSDLAVAQNSTKLAQYRWLLETEEGQRSRRGYQATPAQLVPEYLAAKNDRDSALILRADQGRAKQGAMMFLIHGAAATYHIGWASEEGRRLGAHNLLLWQAIERLKARGIRQLDLGGVNTVTGSGIARFKIGTGGEVVTLAGTYF